MVTEFVGFLAAYRLHGDLSPVLAGVLGAVVTVWAVFAPCFLFIFLGAPYVERLRTNRRLGAALGAVTGAVVGVVASLALTFAVNVLFDSVHTVSAVLHAGAGPRSRLAQRLRARRRRGIVRGDPTVQDESGDRRGGVRDPRSRARPGP